MEADTTFTHDYLYKEHLKFTSYLAYRVLDNEGKELSEWDDIMVRPAAVSKNSAFEASVPRGSLTTTVDIYVPDQKPPEEFVLVPRTLSVIAPRPFTWEEALLATGAVLQEAGIPLKTLAEDTTGKAFFDF